MVEMMFVCCLLFTNGWAKLVLIWSVSVLYSLNCMRTFVVQSVEMFQLLRRINVKYHLPHSVQTALCQTELDKHVQANI